MTKPTFVLPILLLFLTACEQLNNAPSSGNYSYEYSGVRYGVR